MTDPTAPTAEQPAASIRREVTLWRVDSGEYEPEPDSSCWGVFWEPLQVRLGPDARPYCCYGDQIAFYDRSGGRVLTQLVQHYDFLGLSPHLLFVAGKWREVVNTRIEFRGGQWCMRWNVATNTKWARRLNGEPEGG